MCWVRTPPILVSLSVNISIHSRRDWFGLSSSPRDSDCSNYDLSQPERSEPSSRNFLNGEQPYPWKLLHLQDKLSRHRGAELRRRYGRLGATSLLSPG